MSRTEKQIKAFLASEDGKRNAERFIKALKEERILCSVQSVSKSGMSRVIAFREIAKCGKKFTILQFDWFLEQLGYTAKNDGISVGGCGMDMIFHTLYSVAGTLKANGFKVPKDYMILADHYHRV